MSNINETLKSKTVFVTGATSGIGEATAKYLASVGANIIIFGRSEENGKRVENEINKLGVGKAFFVKGDVTSEEDQRRALEQGEKEFGAIHYAFSNAGANNTKENLIDVPLKVFKELFDINVFGGLITLQQVAPYFKKNGGGTIVFNSSLAGLFPRFLCKEANPFGVYAITKTSMDGLVKVATSLEKSHNIKAFSVNPSVYESGMTTDEKAQDIFGMKSDQIASLFNLVFKKVGNPRDIGRVVEHLFDGTTKYLSGQGIFVENDYSFESQFFYDNYSTDQLFDPKKLLHNHIRDSRGEKLNEKQFQDVFEKINQITEENNKKYPSTNNNTN
eukprot:TRINITY_DN240_c0_g1_i3.p1 TRINITY_DN240_c0_g1~~TRINITY_DN240_c0_g1_i3.p1  ORF type:complete len:331 (-),score=134.40 TRINITY_DN240_c0_g1_i3:11-1003(-)